MENLNLFYQDIGPSSSAGRHLTQEEAAKEELEIRISQRYALLEEERHVIKTMAYNDKYKKILNEIWKDKVELDGKTVKEDEEEVKRIKGKALKEKDDPGAFIFPIRLEDMKKIDRGITMINHTQAEAMEKLSNVLFQVGVTTIIAKFLILNIPIDCDAPIVVGRGFLHTMGSILNTSDRIFSTFDGVCHKTFRAARFDVLRTVESDSDDEEEYTMGTNDDKAGSSRSKRSRHETVEEVLLPQVHYEFLLWEGFSRDAKSRYKTRSAQLLPRHIYSPCIVNWDVLNRMDCDGEIDDMLRNRLCHEFNSTYDFDEVCADDELQTKKIIKFRLGGHAYRGLRNDENFNAQDYWLSISREDNLSFSRNHTSYKNPSLEVIHKMITYGLCQRTTGYDKVQKNDLWLLSMFDARHQNGYANVAWVIAKWMKKKGVGTQKESQIFRGQFISKLARKCKVLTQNVVRSLSALIYCRDLDTTTLRDLIDYDGKLIPEDPQPGVPRVGIPRPPRASMQNLYDRMGRMEICQDAKKRMKYS
ncbi:hypothetical protein Tco_0017040 [Tanacetum coccineum]